VVLGVRDKLTPVFVQSQNFTTGHQVLGLLIFAILGITYFWGATLGFQRRASKRRGEPAPEKPVLFVQIHIWVGRLMWLLILVNNGL
jgi:hypothetical protein